MARLTSTVLSIIRCVMFTLCVFRLTNHSSYLPLTSSSYENIFVLDLHTNDPVNSMFTALCSAIQHPPMLSLLLSKSTYCCYSRRSVPVITTPKYCTVFMLLLCGDIEPNPGPRQQSRFPCGYCALDVNWSHRALACDECGIWFHKSCHDISTTTFDNLANESVTWKCFRCKTVNSCDSSCTFHSLLLARYVPNVAKEEL